MYLMGTDIGTHGTKTVLVNTEGKIIAQSFQEYGVLHPKQGWAEQWPNLWKNAAFDTITETIKRSNIDARDIKGISISSLYGGSGITLDKNLEPIRPCIIWADRRATKECSWVEEEIGVDEIFKITGNVIDPYYGYTKMLWIKENEPKQWEKIHRIETPNAYVIRELTGNESVDYSSAGNYGGIFDINRRNWSEEMMEELGIPRRLFPEKLLSSEEVVGEVIEKGSRKSHLRKGTSVCAGGIDAAVSALAAGAIQDGDLASMLGTSMCNGFVSHHQRLSPRLVNFPYVIEGQNSLYSFTGISTAGYSVRWFRDHLGYLEQMQSESMKEDAYTLLDRIAEDIPRGCDNLIFLPHLMVGERAPYWDPYLRGGYIGLTINHTRGHLFRAILEGVAYAMRYSIEAARDTGIEVNQANLVDGGARSPLWRQIIADITDIRMRYIPDFPGTPMGDAFLAGLGTGIINNKSLVEKWVKKKITLEPCPTGVEEYIKFYNLYVDCLKATKTLFQNF